MFQSLGRLRGLISRPAHTYRPTVETFPDLDTQRPAVTSRLYVRGRQIRRSPLPADVGDSGLSDMGSGHHSLPRRKAGRQNRLETTYLPGRMAGLRTQWAGHLVSAIEQRCDLRADLLKGQPANIEPLIQ